MKTSIVTYYQCSFNIQNAARMV